MSYGLNHLKIDIGGPDGNTFFLLAKVCSVIRQVEGKEEASKFRKLCMGQGMSKLGFEWGYEDILRAIIDKTGITLVSDRELPIDPSLYTIEEINATYL